MAEIGIAVQVSNARAGLDAIEEADKLGIPAAWMTTGGIQADALTVFGAAAVRTSQIKLGSAIIPTWPRNPVFVAQQALALENLAPGRIRLGLGPSTEAAMRPFGVDFKSPLRELREYVTVLRSLLHEGQVDFQGRFVRARARIGQTVTTPVMVSALQEKSFALAGEITDGAITWVCPPSYLRKFARPALEAGAASAGREAPPMVVHVPVCVEEDPAKVRDAAQRPIGIYGRFQFYKDMFAKSGHPEAGEQFSQDLTDELVVYGSRDEVARKLRELAASGIGDLMAMPVIVPERAAESRQAAYEAIAAAGKA